MSSPYFRDWPQGAPALFRIRRDLVLAVPPQYQRFWYQGDKVVRLPAPVSAIPKRQRPGVSFQFFLPDFMGYAPQNYTSMFDPHEVNVVELQPADPRDIEPGAVGEYPPNMRKRSLSRLLDTHTAQIMYGLTCYQFARQAPETDNEFMCFGRDAKAGNNYVMLDVSLPPYERWVKFPLMQARYFTPRYGGLRIVWRTEARNFPKWQEIDAQVWKFVKEWSVIPNRTTDAKSR